MIYRDRPVFTAQTFRQEIAAPGDYVDDTVVKHSIGHTRTVGRDCIISQAEELHAYRLDPQTGKWRSTHATLRRCIDSVGVWEFCGYCFQGETESREKAFARTGFPTDIIKARRNEAEGSCEVNFE